MQNGITMSHAPNDNPTELTTYPNEIEAQMAAALLANNGIPAAVQPLGYGYGGVGLTQFIPHRILVPHHSLRQAQQILGGNPTPEN